MRQLMDPKSPKNLLYREILQNRRINMTVTLFKSKRGFMEDEIRFADKGLFDLQVKVRISCLGKPMYTEKQTKLKKAVWNAIWCAIDLDRIHNKKNHKELYNILGITNNAEKALIKKAENRDYVDEFLKSKLFNRIVSNVASDPISYVSNLVSIIDTWMVRKGPYEYAIKDTIVLKELLQ